MDGREQRQARARERERIADSRRAAGRDAPWRRRWRMFRRAAGKRALDLLAPGVLRGAALSWRIERHGTERFEELAEDDGFVAAMWHGSMLPPAPLHRGRGFAVLVSPSDDGGLVVKVLHRFGYRVLRGSTSKRGSRAMREMRDLLLQGIPVVITPDGPRGPAHTVNVGVAWLARESGRPILPVRVSASPCWRLRSWDSFMIPKPFARVRIDYLPTIAVPADTDDDGLEDFSRQLRSALLGAESDSADRRVSDAPAD